MCRVPSYLPVAGSIQGLWLGCSGIVQVWNVAGEGAEGE